MEQRLLQGLQWVEVLLRTKQTQEEEHLLLVGLNSHLRIRHVSKVKDLLREIHKQCIRILHVNKFRIHMKLGLNIHLRIRQDIHILLEVR